MHNGTHNRSERSRNNRKFLKKSKKIEKIKKTNFLGMIRDALGGIGGSSLSIFTGFLKDFEQLNFQKLKNDQNRLKWVKNTFKIG